MQFVLTPTTYCRIRYRRCFLGHFHYNCCDQRNKHVNVYHIIVGDTFVDVCIDDPPVARLPCDISDKRVLTRLNQDILLLPHDW